jgi:hypothetical protein
LQSIRQLEPVVVGLGALTKRIADTITHRNVLAQEKSHYLEKVGQLQANYNSAKPALRDAAKEKLTENQTKLRKVLDEHTTVARNVEEWTQSLDSDMANVLTPMVLSVIRTQAAVHTECASFGTSAISLMGARVAPPHPKPLPEGVAGLMAHHHQLPTDPQAGAASSAGAALPMPPAAASTPQPERPSPAAQSASVADAAAVAAAASSSAPPPSLPRVQPFVAVADADWEAAAEGDLSIQAGALVLVFGADSEGWWDARVSDESGLVPSNFCTVPSTTLPVHARMVSVDDYSTEDPSELAFKKGDAIEILTPVSQDPPSAAVRVVLESGWLLGRNVGGVPGFVPSTYLTAAPATTHDVAKTL